MLPPGNASYFRQRFLWTIVLLLFGGWTARSADVTVEARVSRNVTTLARPVQYQIKITGAERIGNPPKITADGVDIMYVEHFQTSSFRVDATGAHRENTVTLVYQVQPEQHGTFTIPPVQVEADGQKFTTKPVGLTVQQNAPAADDSVPQSQANVEIWVPKTTMYLGETVPMEFRMMVDARVHWQPAEMPTVQAEGLMQQRFTEPHRMEPVTIKGKDYQMLVFKSAITPTKAGKIVIGPGEVIYNAQVPRARRSGAQSFFDMFDDNMLGDAFFSTTQQLKAKATPVELTVKVLPAEGKPPTFSGAVGNFELSVEGTPKQVKLGDPLTIKIRVTGQGNFDRVVAPVLQNAAGWRTYPPSSTFKADKDKDNENVSVKGTKTFEMAVIPETKKTQMPVFQFAYFDPGLEKYVVKSSEAAPLAVEGSLPAPSAESGSTSAVQAAAPQPPKSAPAPKDILGMRYDVQAPRNSFAPLYARKDFLLAQGAPLVVLLGFLSWRLRPRSDETARRMAALRREKSLLLGQLRDGATGRTEFFDAAARVLQIDSALARHDGIPGSDAMEVRALANLDEGTAGVIDEILKTRAELLYAGGHSGEEGIPADKRERVLAALTKFEKCHGSS